MHSNTSHMDGENILNVSVLEWIANTGTVRLQNATNLVLLPFWGYKPKISFITIILTLTKT